MHLQQAQPVAQYLAKSIAPFCERVAIAGSIRRQKAEVKDIELVAVPKWNRWEESSGLFETQTKASNLLYEATDWQRGIQWIKPGVSERVAWHIKPDGKYWRGYLPDQNINLDLFLCERDNFGLIYLIRTGSAEFSQRAVTALRLKGYPVRNGWLWDGEHKDAPRLATPNESDVFQRWGIDYVPAGQRL